MGWEAYSSMETSSILTGAWEEEGGREAEERTSMV